jgi:acetyltransferase-like isoleucine patch superfamily enzyme
MLPWAVRRWVLCKIYKYEIHPTAYIGFSFVFPKHLVMKKGSRIGHFNVAIHLDKIEMGDNASIDRGNWITGFPTRTLSKHFSHQPDRQCELIIGNESAITKNHHIDSTNQIIIGDFVRIAGYRSQFLTHSINIQENRQDSAPILIGDYCFVSTRVVVLGGSVLPAKSVLGAGAVLNKAYSETGCLYGGVPAKKILEFSDKDMYFSRDKGFVV